MDLNNFPDQFDTLDQRLTSFIKNVVLIAAALVVGATVRGGGLRSTRA